MSNWNGGERIRLSYGDSFTCNELNEFQLYGVFLYNAYNHDNPTRVEVKAGESTVKLIVPGTTQNQGVAAICFVDGAETSSLTVSVPEGRNAEGKTAIDAFIGSVSMPLSTSGIVNHELSMTGVVTHFDHYARYYAVPASHQYQGKISTGINTFISVEFTEHKARVLAVNGKNEDIANVIKYAGSAQSLVTIESSGEDIKDLPFALRGRGGDQYVWMNADSRQNSSNVTLELNSA